MIYIHSLIVVCVCGCVYLCEGECMGVHLFVAFLERKLGTLEPFLCETLRLHHLLLQPVRTFCFRGEYIFRMTSAQLLAPFNPPHPLRGDNAIIGLGLSSSLSQIYKYLLVFAATSAYVWRNSTSSFCHCLTTVRGVWMCVMHALII